MAKTGTIHSILRQLEDHISGVPAQREAIDKQLGRGYSPPREAALQNLESDVRANVNSLRAQLQDAFAVAQQEAQQSQGDVARQFGRSADGGRYLAALAGYGAIAGRRSAGQIAQRLQAGIDTGDVAEVRAWRELALLHAPARHGNGEPENLTALRTALLGADEAALTPLEQAADAEAAYVENASRRATAFGNQIDNRLRGVLNGQGDYAAGNLAPANVFEDAVSEASTAARGAAEGAV